MSKPSKTAEAAMLAEHTYEVLALAFRMDASDAAYLLQEHEQAEVPLARGAWVPYIEPVRLQAARIVREWVMTYGPFPTLH
ncbi:MAG: hypothetical protein JWQ52_490 [Phenylobacterium sp.]|jgi:hypothetical protein|nr:hypothetical protein [Phenylobacterium sp.]